METVTAIIPLSHRVKQSDLFDRWKNLQICKWAMDTSEASLFKYVSSPALPPALWAPLLLLQMPITREHLVLSGHLPGVGPKGHRNTSSDKASPWSVGVFHASLWPLLWPYKVGPVTSSSG